MSWSENFTLTWFQKFVINVIKCGPIPRHGAFIMDGNRRHAKSKNVEINLAYEKGLQKLKDLTCWCKEIGILEATVYAFSMDNFKRSRKEVGIIMNLLKDEFERMLEKIDDFMKDGICVRFIGNVQLIPAVIRKLLAEIVLLTKDNTQFVLNVAFCYTSRNEITNAISTVAEGVYSGTLEIADVDEELLTNCMFSNHSHELDILVRTSGETRFSDFLLWQISNTIIYIEDTLWPDFTIWNVLKIVFLYQQTYDENQYDKFCSETKEQNARIQQFLKNVENARMSTLKHYSNI